MRGLLVKAVGSSIDDGEVSGILLIPDHLSDECTYGRLDEIGAILELSRPPIDGLEQVF